MPITKHRFWDFLLVLLLILSAGQPVYAGFLYTGVLAALFLIIFIIYRHRLGNRLFIIGLIFIVFNLLISLKFATISPYFYLRIAIIITISYLAAKLINIANFVLLYDHIIFFFALISIPLYLYQLRDFDTLFSFGQRVNPLISSEIAPRSSNFFIFTVHALGKQRNCGFTWEPGAFAAFLLIGMVFNLIRTGFRLNYRLPVYIIALLSTYSTMGYIVLLIVILFYALNKKSKLAVAFMLPIIVIMAIFYQKLDFVGQEVESQIEYVIESQTEEGIDLDKYGYSLGRFGSIPYGWEVMKMYPLLGVGGEQTALPGNRFYNITNGIVKYIVTFGLLGFAFLIFNLRNTIRWISYYFSLKYNILILLIILLINTSHGLLITPLFFYIQFYGFFIPHKIVSTIPRSFYPNNSINQYRQY